MSGKSDIDLIDELAADAGVEKDARRKWRERGKVPHRWRLPLVEEARRRGQEINSELFDRFCITAEPVE